MMKSPPILLVIAALTALSLKPFPGGSRGIGFDDIGFAPSLRKVMVPGGRTGKLALIDPDSKNIELIGGFTESARYSGGHGEGITSADALRDLICITDRTASLLDIVNVQTQKTVATARLASAPDYVRFVPKTNEVWVTEPGSQRIEIFTLLDQRTPVPTHDGFIAVPGGPESLIIGHGRAFTHLWRGATLAIDLKTRKIVGRWPNGCKGSRGIALDEKRGFLFAGCDEGKLSVLDLKTGRILNQASSGSGVDIIAYDQKLAHVYLPGADSGTIAVVGISSKGAATILKIAQTVKGAHCTTVDDHDQVYVCDPAHGKILVFKDSLIGLSSD
jgi:DNA-binding beta-propeller fold protein YncE